MDSLGPLPSTNDVACCSILTQNNLTQQPYGSTTKQDQTSKHESALFAVRGSERFPRGDTPCRDSTRTGGKKQFDPASSTAQALEQNEKIRHRRHQAAAIGKSAAGVLLSAAMRSAVFII